MPTTIDNLGFESSQRYAENQSLYEQSNSESLIAPGSTAIEVTSTSPSKVDALFEIDKRGIAWPTFSPPTNYHASRRKLFSTQLIPSLGSPEAREMQMQRLKAARDREREKNLLPHETAQIEHANTALVDVLSQIDEIERDLLDINGRRIQYQKG